MKNCISILAFLVLLSNLSAQKVQSTLLYSLKPNEEVMFANEYRLRIFNNKQSYIIFTERYNPKDTQQCVIVDGKEIACYPSIAEPGIFNFHQNGMFQLVVTKNKRWFVNHKGQEFGPYDNIYPAGGWYHLEDMLRDNGNYGFVAKRDGKYIVHVNGKEFGPLDSMSLYYTTLKYSFEVYDDGTFFYRYFDKQGKIHYVINGVEIASGDEYDDYYNPSVIKSATEYCIQLKTNNEWTCYINGKKFGPYLEVKSVSLEETPKGFYYIIANKEGKYMIQDSDGKIVGPFAEVSVYSYSSKNYMYKYKQGDEWFVMINNRIYGPYQEMHYDWKLTNDGNFYFTFKKDGQMYVNVNGREMTAYQYPHVVFGKNGEKGFDYLKDGMVYCNFKGKEFGPYDFIAEAMFSDNGDFFYYYSRNKQTFAVINGKEFGAYESISYSNLTFHNAINFCFKFKKNEKYYINLKGKEIGPFLDEPYFKLLENGEYYYHGSLTQDAKMVYINGKAYGPYKYTYFQDYKENPFMFFNERNGVPHYNINGFDYALMKREKWDANEIFDDNYQHVLSYSASSTDIMLDGQKFAGVAGFGYIYNNASKQFMWLQLKGKDIYVNSLNVE